MIKEYKKVADIIRNENIKKIPVTLKIKAAIATSLILFFCNNIDAATTQCFYEVAPVEEQVICIPVQENNDNVVLQMVDNRDSTSDKVQLAFEKTVAGNKDHNLHQAHKYVLSAVKNIEVDKVICEMNEDLSMLNYSLLLPQGFLLSISKSLDMIEDDYLMFSLFHKRKLLISNIVPSNILAEYISNVQARLNNA